MLAPLVNSSVLAPAVSVGDALVDALGTAGINTGQAQITAIQNTSAEDIGIVQSAVQALVAVLLVSLFYLGARYDRTLMRQVYAPRAKEGAAGAEGFPGFWGFLYEFRSAVRAVADNAVGLEAHMLLRYVAHAIRLVVFASTIGAVLMPFYAAMPASDTNFILDAHLLNCTPAVENSPNESSIDQQGCVLWWAYTERISLAHVPNDSWRLTFAGFGVLLFSAIYVAELTYEWRHYAVAKQKWHEAPGIERKAAVLYVEGEGTPDPDEVANEVARIVGQDEVRVPSPEHPLPPALPA